MCEDQEKEQVMQSKRSRGRSVRMAGVCGEGGLGLARDDYECIVTSIIVVHSTWPVGTNNTCTTFTTGLVAPDLCHIVTTQLSKHH